MKTIRSMFSVRNIAVAALLIGVLGLVTAVGIQTKNNHFVLEVTEFNCPSAMCDAKVVADIRNSDFPGEHRFMLHPETLKTPAPHIPSTIAITNDSTTTAFLANGKILEHGMGCGFGLEFSDTERTLLTGITVFTEDGFGRVQHFPAIKLNPGQVYSITDFYHPNGLRCMFRPRTDGLLDFAVRAKPASF